MSPGTTKPSLRVLVLEAEVPGGVIDSSLRDIGVDCAAATDGDHAAELLRRNKFDAIFLDAQMAAPGGMHLARQIRAGGLNSRTPIIFASGEDTPEVMTRAFASGANLFLYKPIDRSHLLQVMRAARGPIEQERRRFLRVAVRRFVVLTRGEERGEGYTVDLSLEGMLVETPVSWPTGTRIHVQLEIAEGEQPVNAKARITRLAGPNRVGLQLERLTEEQSSRLQSHLLPLILQSLGE